jgi:putative ATP-dependent endonuclease of OLD family
MHISKIEITNYRNFKHLVVEDLPATVVIVGENNVGKSNLLDALRLVLDPSLPDSARVLRPEDFWDGLGTRFGGAEIRVVVEVTGYDDDVNGKCVLADCNVASDPLVGRMTYLYRPRQAIKPAAALTEADYEFVVFGGTDEKKRIGSDVRRYISLRVLPALRDAESDLQNWHRSPLRPLIQRLRIPEKKLGTLAESVKAATETLLSEPSVKGLNDAISKRVEEMAGELFSVPTRLGVAALRSEQMLRAVRLFIAEETERSIGETCLGTANLIFLALLLEELTQQQAAGEVVTTVLGVEEPEAHLHPHLQRVIFRSLLRLDAPLLLSTHSPHIASVTPLASLVVLHRRGQDGTKAYTAAGAGLSGLEVADVERYLDVNRAELLFSKGVILVEGPAELFLVPAFAREMGEDLDSLGISVCSVHGTDFAPYRRLLGTRALNIPNVIITDGDADPDARGIENAGLTRAAKLLGSASPVKAPVDAHLAAKRFSAARTELRRANVFVGVTTLETDLLPAAADAMQAAWNELGVSATVAARFAAEVNAADGGGPDERAALLNRIESKGKGRFAQRLADHLDGVSPPDHIKLAIERIVQKVRDNA